MASSQDVEERLQAALADRYVIERQIGSGGMATVYLATDFRHDRKVALNVVIGFTDRCTYAIDNLQVSKK
jgi:hypothetical protein